MTARPDIDDLPWVRFNEKNAPLGARRVLVKLGEGEFWIEVIEKQVRRAFFKAPCCGRNTWQLRLWQGRPTCHHCLIAQGLTYTAERNRVSGKLLARAEARLERLQEEQRFALARARILAKNNPPRRRRGVDG